MVFTHMHIYINTHMHTCEYIHTQSTHIHKHTHIQAHTHLVFWLKLISQVSFKNGEKRILNGPCNLKNSVRITRQSSSVWHTSNFKKTENNQILYFQMSFHTLPYSASDYSLMKFEMLHLSPTFSFCHFFNLMRKPLLSV